MTSKIHASRTLPTHIPVIGICGYSGSGKTTLITRLVHLYRDRGLRAGVIKQDTHGLEIDREGKDTDRLFKAGADVLIRDEAQVFVRIHREGRTGGVEASILAMAPHVDLILVEGHKTLALPLKVWLCREDEHTPPPDATGVHKTLAWGDDREALAREWIDEYLLEVLRTTPVYAGILIGGENRRMGRPKHLIASGGITWLERIVAATQSCTQQAVLLGGGTIPGTLESLPVLPDIAGRTHGGPLRGMLSAMRWAPHASWIFVACDQPYCSTYALEWLLQQRRPGVHAIMPRGSGQRHPEPLPAWYDWRMGQVLEQLDRPRNLAGVQTVATPVIPAHLADAWRNLNTPEALAEEASAGDR